MFGWWMLACVVHYPEAGLAAHPTQVVTSPELVALESKIDRMLGEAVEVDARDRLEAVWELVHGVRQASPDTQRLVVDAAQKLVAIEERNAIVSTDTLTAPSGEQTFTPVGTGVVEESIDGGSAP